MPNSADLIVRVLADTSNATGNVNALIASLGKLAGVGSGAIVAGGIVEASMKVQDAMARVQTAYNSIDFAPGTTRFQAAQDVIQHFSETTATSFDEVATVYSQGARFIDEFGNRLPIDKLNEYTDTMIRLSKVSTDQLSPDAIGQQVDVLAKQFGTTDFKKLGSEISVASGMHNQGEGPGLDAAIAIGQVGADIGVTQEQALAVGNVLADLGLGGQMGGSAIGRLLQRMTSGADQTLNDASDPEKQFADLKKHREATEKAADLQDELAVAEQRRAQMFGQHGLKTQYRRDPAAVMAADQQIAKLQREINDTQQDNAHLDDGANKTSSNVANIRNMAALLGEDSTQYATEFQDDPISALLKYTGAVSQLPEDQRLPALQKAFGGRGVLNGRDQKVLQALANPDRQGDVGRIFDAVNGQAANPTDLGSRSDIPLGTTSSKVTDASNVAFDAAAAAGNGPREAIDGLTQKVLDNTTAIDKLDSTLASNPLLGTITTGVVAGISTALPILLTRILAGGGGGVPGAGNAATNAVAVATGSGVLETAATTTAVVAATALPFALTQAYKQQTAGMADETKQLLAGLTSEQDLALENRFKQLGYSSIPDAPGLVRQELAELHINVPNVSVTIQTNGNGQVDPQQIATQVYEAVVSGIASAWNHVEGEHPVTGQMGGDYTTGQGPN